ncbi:MAG: glycosyltransferase [Ferruginibacter sp.]|nr:glycosyltransferase [Ferruginibacter sp.]
MAILCVVSVLLMIVYISLLMYYRVAWGKIPNFSAANFHEKLSTQIVVIIPARNEAKHIHACLATVTNQSYPPHLYQVVVVDDHSTDNTADIVRAFPSKNISLVLLKEHIPVKALNSYKKKAIEIGIQQSTGKLIVTTDADCYVSYEWLKTIAAFYEMYRPLFIAAPVSIDCNRSFIEMFQALDFMTLQGITGASVHKKMHSMCNGANLAYERAAYLEVDGFKGIDFIASGDDMLLMHKIYKRFPDRVMFLKSREAIVNTEPVKTIKDFLNQRIRWASKADKYDDKRITAVLAIVYLFNILLIVLPVLSAFLNVRFQIFNVHYSVLQIWILLLTCKTGAELFFLFPVASFFNKSRLLWLFPIMQPFHIIYTVIAGWLGKFGSYYWKDRKVT